jgi:hypothetical protein
MRSRPGTPLQPMSSRMASERLSQPWLTLARSVWVVCALLLLANFVASIPAYYQLLQTICTLPDPSKCATGQLTPNTVQAFANLPLSLSIYVASFVILEVVLSLLPWGLGLLIFWRKSDEWMGLFVSLLLVLYGGTGTVNTFLGLLAGSQSPPLLSTLLNLISGVEWIGLGAFLLTFPTGRFVPRWSWLVLAFWIISFVWNPTPPIMIQFQILQVVVTLGVLGGTLFIMVYRYMHVFDGVQRQQAKWFVYAAFIFFCLLFIGTGLPGVVAADSPSQLLFPIIALFSSALFYLGLGFAILRYRLWDIDVLINRTLVYLMLTISLALIYFGLVIGLGALLRLFTGQLAQYPVVIVVSTLAIAALFQPLRRRIQAIIDRRFYRRKYDAAKTLEAFSVMLRTETDLDQLSEQLVAVVKETMQPTHVSIWLRPTTPARKPLATWSSTHAAPEGGKKA